MSYDKNAFTAKGDAPHEDFDFKAVTGDTKRHGHRLGASSPATGVRW